MGSCIICGASVDGRICDSHQEDVVFEFRGDSPKQLVSGRYYRGTVDGYADFGVFVDLAPGVTGLLHRSELDRRLESLDWEPGDTVFVQVKNVRDNGNVDLGWSIRQAEREFRGALIQDGDEDREPESESGADGEEAAAGGDDGGAQSGSDDGSESADDADDAGADPENVHPEDVQPEPGVETGGSGGAGVSTSADEPAPAEAEGTTQTEVPTPGGSAVVTEGPTPDTTVDRVPVETLSDAVGETVRLEGEIVSVRQTGGPTVFELRDETGVVDCAAFVEPGVRAYPDVEVDDVVRLEGEVEMRRNEIQVETEALVALEADERDAVVGRLEDALAAKARPDSFEPIGDSEAVEALREPLLDAAELVRRAVLESRPIVVRHPATANGYLAGAAVERVALPLVAEEHATSDAEYHYFKRRPLESAVYDMDDATMDVTRMLQDRDRHDEKLPLFLLLGAGVTAESEDGLDMLDVYDATRVVVDADPADPTAGEHAAALVAPADADGATDLSLGALGAELAVAIDADARDTLRHVPATSYWEEVPETYETAAQDATYGADRRRDLREAVALEAYYQSYEDKRELLTDLLFGEGGQNLAGHVAEQFRVKTDAEIATARENLDRTARAGVELALLDTEAYTHRFDFPPTSLLVDELHRRERAEGPFATVGVGMDELFVRSTFDLDLRAAVEAAREAVPEADLQVADLRDGRVEFLAGRREAAREAVVDAVVDQA
ncbi:MAG: OB-fold nucleic acid binding domain-containing protein [Haloferacaceae archaeon]